MLRDLRLATRALRRAPGFTAAATLTLALGIGATTTMFTLVDNVLLRPLPYADADRLVVVGHAAPGAGLDDAGQSRGTYLLYRRESRALEDIALYYESAVTITGGEGDPERLQRALVTPSFFTVLGARAAHGRLFAEDDRSGGGIPVVISHDLWLRRFGGDPGAVGRALNPGEPVPFRIIGVAQPGFHFPRRETQLWFPLSVDPAAERAGRMIFAGIARLRPGVTAEAAAADLNRVLPSLAEAYADGAQQLAGGRLRATVKPLKETVVGEVRGALWLLLGSAGFVFLIACANVAGLMLVRAEHRLGELAVRTALGASRADLAQHFLGEGVVLAALGGALGVAVADVAIGALVAFGPENLPRLDEVSIDARVLAGAAAISVLAVLLLGAVPLLRLRRPALAAALGAARRGATTGRASPRVRGVLVAAQLALALTLLAGAALMAQSFWRLRHADAGFDAEGVLTLELNLPTNVYGEYGTMAAFWHRLLEHVRAIPGVQAAGAASDLPLSGFAWSVEATVAADGAEAEDDDAPPVTVQSVTPGYFEALRIPLVEGRAFEAGDRADASNPVLVSAALGRRLFPDGVALGRRVRRADAEDAPWLTIVGVVGDAPREAVGDGGTAILYIPVLDRYIDVLWPNYMSLAVRTSLPPLSLAPAVRQAIRELDPKLAVSNVRTMEHIVAASTARESLAMLLLGCGAAAALFLGAVGVYGVVSYAVGRRTRELGVRVALGARPADLSRLVLRSSGRITAAGLALGATAALALTRLLRGLLYGVSPTDPVTLGAAVAILGAIALLASYLPARRAGRIDPVEALRME